MASGAQGRKGIDMGLVGMCILAEGGTARGGLVPSRVEHRVSRMGSAGCKRMRERLYAAWDREKSAGGVDAGESRRIGAVEALADETPE